MAQDKILNAKPDDFFKEKGKSKVSKYRESIVNVIGHAIADCITKQKEFANVDEHKKVNVITFKVNPIGYSRANWNAVILYNFVYSLWSNQQRDINDINIDDVFKHIKNNLLHHYENSDIIDLSRNLDTSITDIKEYNKQLDLAEEIIEFMPNEDTNTKKYIKTVIKRWKKSNLDEDYENIMSQSSKPHPEADKSMSFNMNRKVTMQPSTPNFTINFTVDLKYTPNDKVGERWSLLDNNSLQIGDYQKKGFLAVIPNYNIPHIVNCFLQFVECDLELDTSELRDLKYWGGNKTKKYYGKKLILPSIVSANSDQYQEVNYDDLMKEKATRETYFTSYKQMDPSKRAMKVQD